MWGHKVVLVMLVATVPFIAGCERLEVVESSYVSFEEAERSGAIGNNKWIPELMPASASDIREAHDVDTNEVWVIFRFKSADAAAMSHVCAKVGQGAVKAARRSPGTWWPSTLMRATDGKSPRASYEFYQCDSNRFLALDESASVGYFWALK